MPEPLLRNAKQRAAERGVTLSAVIEDALRIHLAGAQKRDVPPFRLFTVKGKLVDPNLDLDRTSAFLLEDDQETFRPRNH